MGYVARVRVLSAGLLVAVAAVSLSSVPAHAAPGRAGTRGVVLGRPGFSASAREFRASLRHLRGAVRPSAAARPGARIARLSRARSNTYAAGSGRLTTRVYSEPVNYRSHGRFLPINAGLARGDTGYRQHANNLGVLLPLSAAAPARVSVAGGSLRFALAGASGRRSVTGRVDRFVPTRGGTALAFSSENTGVGWQARTTGQAGLAWRVRMSRGLHAVLVADGVAFRNHGGRTVWTFTAPAAHRVGSSQALPTSVSLRTVARTAGDSRCALPPYEPACGVLRPGVASWSDRGPGGVGEPFADGVGWPGRPG